MDVERIGLIGVGGTLGLPLALVFCKAGFKVCGVDLDEKKIQDIYVNRTFVEPKINDYLRKYGDNLSTSVAYDDLKDFEVVFIIVQTPSSKSGKLNMCYVRSALKLLHEVNPDCLAVISSTLNMGDMNKLRKIHKRVCYNPEFIARGRIIEDFEKPKFVLIGSYDKDDSEILRSIWMKILRPKWVSANHKIFRVTPIEAEIIKVCSNMNFILEITFANMIGEVCEKFGANSREVLRVLYKDRRSYMPGLGFSGPCFPRDIRAFQTMCEKRNVESGANYSAFVTVLNEYWTEFYFNRILREKRERVGIIGLTYKIGVPHLFESQSAKIAKRLVAMGFEVHAYDPTVNEKIRGVIMHKTIEELLDQVKLVFLGLPYKIDGKLLVNKTVVNPWK